MIVVDVLKEIIRKHPLICSLIMIVLTGSVLLVLGMTVINGVNAASEGANEVASKMGERAGEGAGLIEGVSGAAESAAQGIEDGKAAGLSAEDTKTILRGKMTETGKLEVLTAGVQLENFHTIGEEDKRKYAALYLYKAKAIFSVDLARVQIIWDPEEKSIVINLPQPEIEVYFDETEEEKVAEYQKNYFNGSANDGFDAYLNSMSETAQDASKKLAENETLMNQARNAAILQVSLLANSICGNEYVIDVRFMQ